MKTERLAQLTLGQGLKQLREDIKDLPLVETEIVYALVSAVETSNSMLERGGAALEKATAAIERLDKLVKNATATLEEAGLPRPEDYWDSDDEYSVGSWRYEVANDDTRLGYWPWVANQREMKDKDDDT